MKRPQEPRLSFCETLHAGPLARWHLREVGPEGLVLGGGLRTQALCGRDLAGGWDLRAEPTAEFIARPGVTCPRCVEALSAAEPGQG